jgi:hypothetical protein
VPSDSFKAFSMARFAALMAISLYDEKPVACLVGLTCATHFQPDGCNACSTSYRTPLWFMSG